MSTDVAVIPTTLVAVSSVGQEEATATLKGWLQGKIAQVAQDLADLTDAEAKARARQWDLRSYQRLKRGAEESATWYHKLLNALDAGYTLMPDLPMRLFAVRRDKAGGPPPQTWNVEKGSYYRDGRPELESDVLPAGEGEYVASHADRAVVGSFKSDKDPTKTIQSYENIDYRPVGFPIAIVKPQLIEATDRAMQRKIFDEIGVCVPTRSGSRGDPLILGRIYRDRKRQKAVCFVIGWYVQVRDLL